MAWWDGFCPAYERFTGRKPMKRSVRELEDANMDLESISGIRDLLTQPELMAQAAEECMELGHALLQLRRAIDDENPTRVSYVEAVRNVNEEWADVKLCMNQLTCIDNLMVMSVMHIKNARWMSHLIRHRRKEYGKHED